MRTSRAVSGFGWAIVVFVSAGVAAAPNTVPQAQSTPPPQEVAIACWLDEPELHNPHQRRDPKPLGGLPEALRQVPTARSVVHFKLCVDLDGLVARVVVLRSSGRRDVDTHYASLLSTWEFPPLEREDTAVRSVVPVAVVLHR